MEPYLIAFILSFGIVWWVHPHLVKFALDKNIVDKPNARKLNRIPVPVLGGVGVFLGFVVSLYAVVVIMQVHFPDVYMLPLLLMLAMGVVDDMCDLKPKAKFVVQTLAVLSLFFLCDLRIDNFHGIFGIYEVPFIVSFSITLVACVGLINALNLIDGIDGLSSGYSIVASGLFAIWAFMQNDNINLLLTFTLIGALTPFFIYNVFGKKNKMFIGDAGSHLLGIIFCIVALHAMNSPLPDARVETALIPFVIAVLSHPIMDTLRVMTMRMYKGHSPFKADKTHLHHALVARGFSHLATTLTIVGLNLLVVAAWLVCYECNMSATCQLFVVIMFGVLCIVLPYSLLVKRSRGGSGLRRCFWLR